MKRRVLKREAAKLDLLGCARYIAQGSPPSALRFLAAAARAFDQLSRMPRMGAAYGAIAPALRGMRRFPIRGFEDYQVFYFPLEDGIEVVRVLHGARDVAALFRTD